MTTKAYLTMGIAVDLAAPKIAPIGESDLRLIAEALAKMNLYVATAALPYSAAQHAVLVAQVMRGNGASPEAALYGLHHHTYELLTGALSRAALNSFDDSALTAVDTLRSRLDSALMTALGIPYPPPMTAAHQFVDAHFRVAATELRDIARYPAGKTDDFCAFYKTPTLPTPIRRSLTWPDAADAFLETARALAAEAGRP